VDDHALMDELLAKEGPEGFAPAWFRAHHFEKEAQYVETHHRLSLGTPPGAEPDRVC